MDISGLFAYMSESWTLLVVILAAIAGFSVGGVWYAPQVFGGYWMKEMGMDMSDHKAGSAKWVGMCKMFGLTLIQAIFLTIVAGPVATVVTGAMVAALIAIGFVTTSYGINAVAERRTRKFFFINAGYAVVSFAVMGAVIGGLL